MKHGGRIRRKTRLRICGRSRFPRRRCPEFREWLRQFPCVVSDCENPTECAHVKSRGAGGDDVGQSVPMCPHHHRFDLHQHGIHTFQLKYRLDLAQIAAGYGEAWAQWFGTPAAFGEPTPVR